MANVDWNKEIDKWKYGMDINEASKDDLNIYTQAKIHQYIYNKSIDSDLWELYQDDFKDFDIDIFLQLILSVRQELRKHLCTDRVYLIKNTKAITIS